MSHDSDSLLKNAKIRAIKQQLIMECPHYIIMPQHYRDDDSCRCDDPTHTEMEEWGYAWDGDVWRAAEVECA